MTITRQGAFFNTCSTVDPKAATPLLTLEPNEVIMAPRSGAGLRSGVRLAGIEPAGSSRHPPLVDHEPGGPLRRQGHSSPVPPAVSSSGYGNPAFPGVKRAEQDRRVFRGGEKARERNG